MFLAPEISFNRSSKKDLQVEHLDAVLLTHDHADAILGILPWLILLREQGRREEFWIVLEEKEVREGCGIFWVSPSGSQGLYLAYKLHMSHVVNYRVLSHDPRLHSIQVSDTPETYMWEVQALESDTVGDFLIYPKHTAFTIHIHHASYTSNKGWLFVSLRLQFSSRDRVGLMVKKSHPYVIGLVVGEIPFLGHTWIRRVCIIII